MDHILKVSNLNIRLNDRSQKKDLVNNLSFNVLRGSIFGIVGESGSGKTLTALALMGLFKESIFHVDGSISLWKENEYIELSSLDNDSISKIRGNDMAMIFQEPLSSINPNKKCGNQLVEAILIHQNIGTEAANFKIFKLLNEVGLEDEERVMSSYPHQLSGGQLQRVMIAMSIVNEPMVLIADEPTTSLDVTTQKEILDLLTSLTKSRGMTTVLISHDPAVMAGIADEMLVLKNGNMVESGSSHQLLHSPVHDYTRSLLDTTTHQNLPSELQSNQAYDGEQILLNIQNLRKSFQIKKTFFSRDALFTHALNDVSMKIVSGQIHGVVGESGSGKSTLVKCVIGLQAPDKGEIFYESQPVHENGVYVLDRTYVQMVFQDPYSSLNPRMKVGNAIYEAIPGNDRNKKDKVFELLEEVGLDKSHYNRYPHQLSGGQRQRICIARALASNPKLLICDEAVSALDKNVQNKIVNLLLHLKTTYNLTIIFISHDLSVIRKLCDQVTVMYKGRVEESGKTESIFKSPGSPYTKKLINSIPDIPGKT